MWGWKEIDTIWRINQVVESAQWFAQGYFGRSWITLNATLFSTIPEDNVTQSWITPSNTCKNWQYAFGNNVRLYCFSFTLLYSKNMISLLLNVNVNSFTQSHNVNSRDTTQ